MKQLPQHLLSVIFIIVASFTLVGQVQVGHNINGEDAGEVFGRGFHMPNNKTIAVGIPYNNDTLGKVAVFSWNGIDWVNKGSLIESDNSIEQFGEAVFMPGENTVAIGAPGSNFVKIFDWNGLSWTQRGGNIVGQIGAGKFGTHLVMPDSITIAIAAPESSFSSSNSGQIRVYKWNGVSWVPKGLALNGEGTDDYIGFISMPDANTISIGSSSNDGNGFNAGHVRVFKWSGSSWIQKGIDIDGQFSGALFGRMTIMPDTNTLIVGSSRYNLNFVFYFRVYTWLNNSWVQKGSDVNHVMSGSTGGFSLTTNSNRRFSIGLFTDGNPQYSAGVVRTYDWDGSAWVQYKGDINGINENDFLGSCLSVTDSNTIAIGVMGGDSNGENSGYIKVMKLQGSSTIYNDINQDCIHNNESGIRNQVAVINPGNTVIQTNEYGQWYLDNYIPGNYNITYDIPSGWTSDCPASQSFVVYDTDAFVITPDFGMISNNPCSKPDVSLIVPNLRRCFSNQIVYVQACNAYTATGPLNAAYVDVELDTLLTPTSSSLSYTNLGNNQYRFQIDTLNPGQCVNFTINTTVSCAANLQQTLCMEARLFPADSCVFDTIPTPTLPVGPGTVTPCNLPWDRSSLSVDGYCANDTVYFTVTNNGSASNGNMLCYAPVRVYVDGVLSYTDSIMLGGGQTITYSYLGNGQTWILQADQHPLHPGNSHPNAHVEACGNIANWTPGLVNNLPLDDADPIVDIYCGVVSGSYDPNDKTGFPTGLGTQHEILPNQQLQYLIRFQNTGTDTAFNIVVRDTLDTDLNIFSVVPGVASHNYSFRMYGPRVLEWTFNNIMLPDSNVNEATSHGFLTFRVDQQPNLLNGTKILNDADIYFDFNAPVITNQTVHTINNWINAFPVGVKTNIVNQTSTIKVYPNPTTEMLNVEIANLQSSNLPTLITIENMLGQVVYTKQTTQQLNQFNISTFVSGVYFIKVVSGGKTEYVKLLKL